MIMTRTQIIINFNNVFPFLKPRNRYYLLVISGHVSDHHGRLREMSTSPTHAPPTPSAIPYTSPPVTVVLTVILLLFFFLGFFSIYFCRCFMQNVLHIWQNRQNPTRADRGPGGDHVHPGLDPLIINSFPTFTYSSVKDYHRENYGLECAICLCEFKDDNILRLLTKCYHVFHQDCIDQWLGSHKTCPCCRCSLDTPINSPEKSPVSGNTAESTALPETGERSHESREDSVIIDVKENDEKHVVIDVGSEDKIREGFTRCKSTGHGHSVRVRDMKESEKDDKFTLRLPQDVQDKLVSRHKLTRSCTEFGEYKSKT